MSDSLSSMCLLLGSNIESEKNLARAVSLLKKQVTIVKISSVWESEAIGSDGPKFLNAAVLVTTSLNPYSLKKEVLDPLETQMGRVRTMDKNSPRTIDVDIMLFDQQVLDENVWKYAYCAVPISQVMPECKSETGEPLTDVASSLAGLTPIVERLDVKLN